MWCRFSDSNLSISLNLQFSFAAVVHFCCCLHPKSDANETKKKIGINTRNHEESTTKCTKSTQQRRRGERTWWCVRDFTVDDRLKNVLMQLMCARSFVHHSIYNSTWAREDTHCHSDGGRERAHLFSVVRTTRRASSFLLWLFVWRVVNLRLSLFCVRRETHKLSERDYQNRQQQKCVRIDETNTTENCIRKHDTIWCPMLNEILWLVLLFFSFRSKKKLLCFGCYWITRTHTHSQTGRHENGTDEHNDDVYCPWLLLHAFVELVGDFFGMQKYATKCAAGCVAVEL